MARLTTEQVRIIVGKALKEVADFEDSAHIDNFAFDRFNKFHKEVFCAELKRLMAEEPYHADGGGTLKDRCYDITLNSDLISEWTTVGDCIQYIVREQSSFGDISREKLQY